MDMDVICTEMTVQSAGTVKKWEETSVKEQNRDPLCAPAFSRWEGEAEEKSQPTPQE